MFMCVIFLFFHPTCEIFAGRLPTQGGGLVEDRRNCTAGESPSPAQPCFNVFLIVIKRRGRGSAAREAAAWRWLGITAPVL